MLWLQKSPPPPPLSSLPLLSPSRSPAPPGRAAPSPPQATPRHRLLPALGRAAPQAHRSLPAPGRLAPPPRATPTGATLPARSRAVELQWPRRCPSPPSPLARMLRRGLQGRGGDNEELGEERRASCLMKCMQGPDANY
ncbi:hypothetical protein BS78_05G217500 [Paspalum vaginatum]|nr:hypothetical protein BS78_05G217500 [Paspalum vaginatum]